MITNGRNGASSEWLKAQADMETEELEALEVFARASEENQRKDAVRYSMRACDKTLAEFELLGFQGVQITRGEDGALVFTGIPREIPRFLKSA